MEVFIPCGNLMFVRSAKVVPEKSRNNEYCAIDFFRITLTVCLGLTTILGGYFTYYVLAAYELRAVRISFDAVIEHMETYGKSSFHAKVSAMHTLRTFLKTQCPHADDWPNCVADIDDYNILASAMMDMTGITTCNHEARLSPNEITSFVDFMVDFYNSSGYPDIADIVLGGVFAVDDNNTVYTVTESSEGENSLVVPILQIGYPRENSGALMFNIYSGTTRISSIDDILACVKEFDGVDGDISAYSILNSCMKSSAIISLVEDLPAVRPATVLMGPVLVPIDQAYEDSLDDDVRNKSLIVHLRRETLLHVGSMSIVFHWDRMLSDSVFPSTTGLDVVLSDPFSEFTYTFNDGTAKIKSEGNRHQAQHARDFVKFPISFLDNNDFSFHLKVYLDETYASTHRTYAPIYGCIITVAVIVMSALQFFAYDFYVTKRYAAQDRAKKKYVRYISHEIRTPLTTVILGIKYVKKELHELMNTSPRSTSAVGPCDVDDQQADEEMMNDSGLGDSAATSMEKYSKSDVTWEKLCEGVDMLCSVEFSCATAIRILNDMLNYDKIKSSELTLDSEMLDCWNLVRTVTKGFLVQAREKEVEVILDMDSEETLRHSNRRSSNSQLSLQKQRSPQSAASSTFVNTPGMTTTYQIVSTSPSCGHDSTVRGDVLSHVTADVAPLKSLVLYGDNLKLEQVMRNLISNALKFTPTGGRVTVSAKYTAEDVAKTSTAQTVEHDDMKFERCGVLVISVTDTGVGLSEDNLKHLFEEGWQYEAKKLQAGGGSGLGLWISKNIIELHGGNISCQSQGLDKGCTMIVEMPVYKRCGADVDVENQVECAHLLRSERGTDIYQPPHTWTTTSGDCVLQSHAEIRSILIADDSALCRKMVSRVLVQAGYKCVQCGDGEECVNRVLNINMRKDGAAYTEDVPIDLILLDYEMPLMNGPAVAKRLRDEGCTLPIIGLTGNVAEEEIEFFRAAGANEIVRKPFSLDQLHSAIDGAKKEN